MTRVIDRPDIRQYAPQGEVNRLRAIIVDAMEVLEGASMGAVGGFGPTLNALDDHVEETGQPWEGCSDYHTMQKAWRILEGAGQ